MCVISVRGPCVGLSVAGLNCALGKTEQQQMSSGTRPFPSISIPVTQVLLLTEAWGTCPATPSLRIHHSVPEATHEHRQAQGPSCVKPSPKHPRT